MKAFLIGILCGQLLTLGCASAQTVFVPVLKVPADCPAFRELPYLLDSSTSDDEMVCVSIWRESPLDPMRCLKVGELKALIAGLKGS